MTNLTEAQTYLYNLGFIMTTPGYYETPLTKDIVAICDNDKDVTYYNTSTDEMLEVATSVVGDNNTNYELVNGLT